MGKDLKGGSPHQLRGRFARDVAYIGRAQAEAHGERGLRKDHRDLVWFGKLNPSLKKGTEILLLSGALTPWPGSWSHQLTVALW